jgi:hypothetical protein
MASKGSQNLSSNFGKKQKKEKRKLQRGRQTPVGIDDKQEWMENEKEKKMTRGFRVYLPTRLYAFLGGMGPTMPVPQYIISWGNA